MEGSVQKKMSQKRPKSQQDGICVAADVYTLQKQNVKAGKISALGHTEEKLLPTSKN